MSDNAGVHLFSNGFEFECWTEANCAQCPRDYLSCDLASALFDDSLTHDLPSGNVTEATAARLGYTEDFLGHLGWPCKERETVASWPDGVPPAADEMAKAGATPLPGFDRAGDAR